MKEIKSTKYTTVTGLDQKQRPSWAHHDYIVELSDEAYELKALDEEEISKGPCIAKIQFQKGHLKKLNLMAS